MHAVGTVSAVASFASDFPLLTLIPAMHHLAIQVRLQLRVGGCQARLADLRLQASQMRVLIAVHA